MNHHDSFSIWIVNHFWLVVSKNVGNGHIRDVNLLVPFFVEWVEKENWSDRTDFSYRKSVSSESLWWRWRSTSSFLSPKQRNDNISVMNLGEKICCLTILFMSFAVKSISSLSVFELTTNNYWEPTPMIVSFIVIDNLWFIVVEL